MYKRQGKHRASRLLLANMSDFDDRSGIIACITPWGRWWQTIDDVTVEVNVPEACKAKEIQCSITPNSLSLAVRGGTVFKVLNRNTITV